MPVGEILAALAIMDRGKNTIQGNIGMEQELEAGGINVPWWKKALAAPFGLLGQEALGMHLESQVGAQRANADPLRGVESAGITAAAIKEMEAARNIMRQEIGTGVQSINQRFAQAGTFQSGARGRAEDQFRQQGLGRLSDAFAGIELEAIRARQSGAASTIALQMQEAQFAWQKRAQENAMITSLVSTALPFIMKQGAPDAGLSLDPTQAFADMGIDPFLAQGGGNWRQLQGSEAAEARLMF